MQRKDTVRSEGVVEHPAGGVAMMSPLAGAMRRFDLRTLEGTDLELGQVVPAAPMVDAASGDPVSLWDLRQRFAAAVCFLHSRCRTCALFARRLRVFATELRDLHALAIAVVPDEIDLEPPVWIDRDGLARERLLSPDASLPAVLIVDRYGAVAGSFHSGGHSFPSPGEIVATLRHLDMECPECGVSEW